MVKMLSKRNKDNLLNILKGQVLFNEPMKNHTSFRIGGSADAFITPVDLHDLKNTIEFSRDNAIPMFILGNGTNILEHNQHSFQNIFYQKISLFYIPLEKLNFF